MKRREFLTLVSGAVAAWPIATRAQLPAKPVIGFLHYASPESFSKVLEAFREGLKEAGYIEGQNVTIEYRWAEGHYDQLPALAADLVHRQVTVIVAGGTLAAKIAKRTTTKIPIVFTSGEDPVEAGLVDSISRPKGNLTGVTSISGMTAAKRLELTRELLPRAQAVAMIVNPTYPGADAQMAEIDAAGRTIGMQIVKIAASNEQEIDAAFATGKKRRVDAFVVGVDGFFITQRRQFAALSEQYAMPTIYPFSDFVRAGGLVSYGARITGDYRQAGVYTGRILKGANPSDLPVMQPAVFELVINLKTAKSLGFTVPASLLSRTDEVIE
jgi:putative tryptophan/tyrosine transport system substrate-binding protein